jgi:hypothetical protein
MVDDDDSKLLADKVDAMTFKHGVTVLDKTALLQRLSLKIPFPTFASDDFLAMCLQEAMANSPELFRRPEPTRDQMFLDFIGPKMAAMLEAGKLSASQKMALGLQFNEHLRNAGRPSSQAQELTVLEAKQTQRNEDNAKLSSLHADVTAIESKKERTGYDNARLQLLSDEIQAIESRTRIVPGQALKLAEMKGEVQRSTLTGADVWRRDLDYLRSQLPKRKGLDASNTRAMIAGLEHRLGIKVA